MARSVRGGFKRRGGRGSMCRYECSMDHGGFHLFYCAEKSVRQGRGVILPTRLAKRLRTQLTIAPNFFSKLIQIVNQIWSFMFEGGGKHNSQIEIPSCFMHIISRFCSCFFRESEIWFTIEFGLA